MKKELTERHGGDAHAHKEGIAENALAMISQLPAILLNSSANMDYAIDEVLAKTGGLCDASRAYVMLEEKDGKYLRNTHEWVGQKTGPAMFSWPLYDYEYEISTLKQIITEHEFFFAHTRDVAVELAGVLTKQGIFSFCVAPITCRNKRIGLIGMDFCETERECRPDFMPVLRNASGLIALAIECKHSQTMRTKLVSIRKCIADIDPLLASHPCEDANDTLPRPAKPTTLLDAERRIIIETLELYSGNKLKTAKHLGLTWPSLDRRCKKLGIEVRRR